MKQIKSTKPFPTLNDLHIADETTLLDFLNNNCKDIGTVNYMGAFIDDVQIKNDVGIRATLKYVIVERNEYKGERAGNDYKKTDGTKDIFEMVYELPDNVTANTEEQKFVILPTVETFTCPTLEQCPKCKGSGRCQSCDGRGFNMCNSCQGSGKRSVRDGQYANGNPKYKNVACSSCHGSGRKSCVSCNGTSKCSRCDGSGKVTCSRCNGTGFYQVYKGYTNKYIANSVVLHNSDFEEIKTILPKADGNIGFDDELIEWINKSKTLFDNRNNSSKINKHAPAIIENIEKHITLSSNQKIGRVHAKIETIPITKIDYSFEGKQYQLLIVGKNNIICYKELPQRHSYKQSIFKRLISSFTRQKRKIAFAYIASFMLNADDTITNEEIKLLETFLSYIKMKQEKRSALINDLGRKLKIEDIKSKISCLKGDKRALVFAWQCVMQDKEINKSEIEAFAQLVSYFKIKQGEVDLLKNKAVKFSQLKDSQMLEEYFK